MEKVKQAVVLSAYSAVLSGVLLIVLAAAAWRVRHEAVVWLPVAVLAILIVCALIYMPLGVSVGDNALVVRRPLATLRMPLADIASARLLQPTMGARRICGSGGWLGWWGWYTEGDTGKYFAYYGKASDCFLVTMTDGRRYVLGCRNPRSVLAAIPTATI